MCQSLGGTSLFAKVIHCVIVLKSEDLWKKTKQTAKAFCFRRLCFEGHDWVVSMIGQDITQG